MNRSDWQQVLAKLRRAKLLAEEDDDHPNTLDAHPLVREHFAQQLKEENPEAWREGNNRLYEYFKGIAKEFPETIQEMDPLFMAVVYGCNAGRHSDALHEIYLPRIMRGKESFAARKLGAHGAVLSALVHFMVDGEWGNPVTPSLPEHQGLSEIDQLTVLTQAGLYLTATKGYASDDVMACHNRVEALCTQLGKNELLYTVLLGQWRYSLVTNELPRTLEIAKKIYALAKSQNEPALLMGAYRSLAVSTYFKGTFSNSLEYARQGIALWDPEQVATVEEYYAPIVTCMAIESMVLWHFGLPDQARARIREAVDLSRRLGDMSALAVALFFFSYINQFCQLPQDTLESAEELIEVCSAQGFPQWLAAGKVLKGWALAKCGDSRKGIALLKNGLMNWRDAGAGLSVSFFLAIQTQVLDEATKAEEAIELIDEAQSYVNWFQEHWWLAELYRLKGECLRKSDPVEAESLLNTALSVATSQQSKSLELRAALSLNRLWSTQGRDVEAVKLLNEVYQRFTEGWALPDLKEVDSVLKSQKAMHKSM